MTPDWGAASEKKNILMEISLLFFFLLLTFLYIDFR